MKSIAARVFAVFVGLSGVGAAHAEGGCPSGMYPIGGQGVQGCAPMGGAAGSTSQQMASPPPRPLGEWIRTWGGVAVSETTSDAGVSTGQLTRKEAERDAMAKCANSGARDCRVSVTYFNQCMSWVVPSGRTGNGRSGIGTGPTLERAAELAQGICQNDMPGACALVYENCTEQIFRSY